MERFCSSIDEKDLVDVALPTEGIIAGNRVELLVRTLTGNKTFAQTQIPLRPWPRTWSAASAPCSATASSTRHPRLDLHPRHL